MTWSSSTNSDYSAIDVTSNFGHDMVCNDGNTRVFDLPANDTAAEDQSIRIMVNLRNASSVEIKSWTTDGGTGSVEKEVLCSASLHFMFDNTNSKWRIVSDDKIMSIEDADNPLTALSGNNIKDHNGDLIYQSGVDVVGINSINGKQPAFNDSTSNIDIGTINSKTPILSGDDATLGNISAGDITADSLTVNNQTTDSIVKYTIDNTITGALYDAIETYYGFPEYDEFLPVNIIFLYGILPSSYMGLQYFGIYKTGTDSYQIIGSLTQYNNSYTFKHSLSIVSTMNTSGYGDVFYLYA